MRGLGVVLASLVLAAHVVPAHADSPLAQARQAVDASDYLTARAELAKALAAGGADPDELAELYKLSGIVEAALGENAKATTAFAAWIALDPKAALPAGTSPKLMRPFDAARKQARKLQLKTETAADPPAVTIAIASDPIGIARARVVVSVDGKPEQTREGAGGERITVALPRGKRLDLRVELLDEHGNRVAVLGTKDVPIVIVGAEPPAEPGASELAVAKSQPPSPAEPPQPRALYLRWWLWGAATVAVGAAGTYFGLQARSENDHLRQLNNDSQDHQFSEALAVESRARRDLLLFDIGMIGAGALAVTTAVLYITEPRRAKEVHVTAVPGRGGGAVVVGGTF